MKKVIFTLVILFTLQPSVYSQFKNYNNTGEVKILASRTILSISTPKDVFSLTPKIEGVNAIAAAGSVLPPLLDLVITTVQEKAKKNILDYKGEYKCSVSGENFYESSDQVALPQLTIKRLIKPKNGTEEETVVEITLIPELSNDKTAFRYVVQKKFIYKYSIAKTKRDYDYIDLNLEINFKSIFIDNDAYKISNLRTTVICIPMICVGNPKELDTDIYSGWIPLPKRSMGVKTDSTDPKNTTTGEIKDNTGLYEIEITATETNPYKLKAEYQQKIIESSSEPATALLNAIIELLATEEKKDKKK